MKTCTTCHTVQPIVEFSRGRPSCRSCNTTRHRARSIRHVMEQQLKGQPCLDCGGVFAWECMDFDHVLGHKVLDIARLSTYAMTRNNLDRLHAEIAKCELICANCHRTRTWRRRYEFQRHRRHKSRTKQAA